VHSSSFRLASYASYALSPPVRSVQVSTSPSLMLIIKHMSSLGSLVANEAMLTGESVPQIKESLALVDQEQMGIFTPGTWL
jgi:hypothetical protein